MPKFTQSDWWHGWSESLGRLTWRQTLGWLMESFVDAYPLARERKKNLLTKERKGRSVQIKTRSQFTLIANDLKRTTHHCQNRNHYLSFIQLSLLNKAIYLDCHILEGKRGTIYIDTPWMSLPRVEQCPGGATHTAMSFPLLNKAIYSLFRTSLQIREKRPFLHDDAAYTSALLQQASLCRAYLHSEWYLVAYSWGCFVAVGPGGYALSLCSQEHFWDLFCDGNDGICTWIWVIPLSLHTVASSAELWQELSLVLVRCLWLSGRQVHKSGMFDFSDWQTCQLWFSKPVISSSQTADQCAGPVPHCLLSSLHWNRAERWDSS